MSVETATWSGVAHDGAPGRRGLCWRGQTSNDRAAEVAHALGHPARIEIVRCLADHGPLTSGDVVEGSGLAQSTVSEHLRILRDAGIVGVERDGSKVWNHLRPTGVSAAIDSLCDVAEKCSSQGS